MTSALSVVPCGAVFRLRRNASPSGPAGGFTTSFFFAAGFVAGGFLGRVFSRGAFRFDGMAGTFPDLVSSVEKFGDGLVAATTAGLGRRHSARAARDTTTQTRASPATIIHSKDPLCSSGSKPVSA